MAKIRAFTLEERTVALATVMCQALGEEVASGIIDSKKIDCLTRLIGVLAKSGHAFRRAEEPREKTAEEPDDMPSTITPGSVVHMLEQINVIDAESTKY